MSNNRYIDRPPRIQPELPRGIVDIPNPPKEEERQPLWQAAIPVVTILGYVLVSATGQGSSIAFLVPMALAVIISTGLTIYNAINSWRRSRQKRADYARRLVEMRREMVATHNRQRTFYEYNYPDSNVVLEMRGDRMDNRSGSRLWERRHADQDFGVVRLGKGTRGSTVQYRVKRDQDGDENPQIQDAVRLAEDSVYVDDVPITIPLYQHQKDDKKKKEAAQEDGETEKPPAARHTVGIAGEKDDVYEFVYPLLAHAAAFHTPSDANVFVLGMHEAAKHWNWLYDLPHSIINESKGQYRLYFEDCERVVSPVKGTVEELNVQPGRTIKAGHVVARIRAESDGLIHEVRSATAGRVQGIGRLPVEMDQPERLIDVGSQVEQGMVLARLDDFELAMQQLEEELDPRKGVQSLYGKDRKREVAGVPRFWKEKIWAELDRRARRLRDQDENDNVDVTLPFMLIVVDLLDAELHSPPEIDPLKKSWLDDLEGEAAISLLMDRGLQLGACVLFLVPNRSKVPSGCQSVVELKRAATGELKFLYAETGLNTPRHVGTADTVPNPEGKPNRKLTQFARELAQWDVRRSYGADIPRAVGLLPLYDTDTIARLNINERWYESTDPRRAEWPKIPLGMLAGQEVRNLHFFADADGVHGMIAGSTGSGKSELLMTIILSLAVKYDPSMVNFVLIDFKGGAAFDPFRNLPHVVDIVTNLRGNAVARMFAAINAELNRRQQVNQDNDVKDIVRYRKAGLHKIRSDNYPHLFIIIDEFAEMIANNPEYKAQLDSITRLGRALGVSLVLAAQRPTGVTDQMRANIKFRICLRVETREESSELLRLPDAAYLPSIPGRGYLQVGSQSLELVQVGYTGMTYSREDYNALERYENRDIIWESDLQKEEDEPMYDVMVRRMATMAREIYGDQPTWRKPWPNPLPQYLALDHPEGIEVDYLLEEDQDYIREDFADDQKFVLAPLVDQWFKGRTEWPGIDWENRAMQAVIGLIDDAANARLLSLQVDFTVGHQVIFGAPGWGKSTVARSLITYLVTTHAPDELNLYMMDFGNRSLQIFEPLPHTGAYIVSHEKERIERLMRMLEQIVDERKEIISQANVANLPEYNQAAARHQRSGLPNKLPALLVVIDNFAEFRDSYEDQFEVLTSLVREGLSNGVYFLVTAEQSSTIGKLFNLFTERLTLKLSDEGEYANIVGRGALPVDDIPGRGLKRIGRSPLEIQVAMPVGFIDDEEAKSEADRLLELVTILQQAGRDYARPPQINILEQWVVLPELISEQKELSPNGHVPANALLGRSDYDLLPFAVSLDQRPHFIVTGPPSSGKTNALHAWILSLAAAYSPEQVAMVMIDYQGGLVDYGGSRRLDELPHALQPVIMEPEELNELVLDLENEFFYTEDRPYREVFVIIDNYDDFGELAMSHGEIEPRRRLGDLARRAGKQGLHFIIAGMRDSMSGGDELVRPISANRFGLAMDAETAESSPFYAAVPRSYSQMQLPRGRGFIVTPGKVSLLQVAIPYADPSHKIDALDNWVAEITAQGYSRAEWLPRKENTDKDSANGSTSRPRTGGLSPEQRKAIIARIESEMGLDDGTLSDSLGMLDDESLLETAEGYGITRDSLSAEPGD